MLKDSFIRISRSKIKNRAPYLTKNKIRMEENK
jgi:hypothetical protein